MTNELNSYHQTVVTPLGCGMSIQANKITGKFVLISTEAPNDQNEPPETLYFESSVGTGKANYWTVEIEKAHIFTDLDDAITMLIETNRSYAPVFIRSIESTN